MPTYSIWFVGESHITPSLGTLDGQSDGSNLVGETIVFDSIAWERIDIRDSDDGFSDSDGNQVIDGTQTLDGVTYTDGTRVDAEYQVVVTDGTNSYTLVAVNFHNSTPTARAVEGFAFIGDVPPPGVSLTVVSTAQGPNNTEAPASSYTPPCFTAGTRIRTLDGEIPIEWLQVGDRVITRDRGAQPLIWIGRVLLDTADLRRNPRALPIRIRAHAFGPGRPERDMTVSPQHRILIRSAKAEYFFGEREVLVAAQHLIDGGNITRVHDCDRVEYFHLLFDNHEIIYADGLETESFQPGPQTMSAFPGEAQDDLVSFFPELAAGRHTPRRSARLQLRAYEATILMDQSPISAKTPGSISGKSSAISPGPKRRAHST